MADTGWLHQQRVVQRKLLHHGPVELVVLSLRVVSLYLCI